MIAYSVFYEWFSFYVPIRAYQFGLVSYSNCKLIVFILRIKDGHYVYFFCVYSMEFEPKFKLFQVNLI